MLDLIQNQITRSDFQGARRKLRNGAVLAKSEAAALLSFIENVGRLIAGWHTEPLFKLWPKALGELSAPAILSELIVAFTMKRPGTALVFHIDSTARLEVILLELSLDPENPFDQFYCFRVNAGDWGITWKIGNLNTALMMIREYIEHKDELRQRITEAQAADDLAPPLPEPQPEAV